MTDRAILRPDVDARNIARGLVPVDPHLVDRLQAMVTDRTDEALMERFGISYNTWRKLIAGRPVRASLLCRLQARVAKLESVD